MADQISGQKSSTSYLDISILQRDDKATQGFLFQGKIDLALWTELDQQMGKSNECYCDGITSVN